MPYDLEKESAAYARLKTELLAHEGEFALIGGDELLGIYPTYDDAIRMGYEKRKLEPFMVKKIQAIETVQRIFGPMISCRT